MLLNIRAKWRNICIETLRRTGDKATPAILIRWIIYHAIIPLMCDRTLFLSGYYYHIEVFSLYGDSPNREMLAKLRPLLFRNAPIACIVPNVCLGKGMLMRTQNRLGSLAKNHSGDPCEIIWLIALQTSTQSPGDRQIFRVKI